jgi:hypothetical protein
MAGVKSRWTDWALSFSAIVVLAVRPATDIFSDSRDPTASISLRPSLAIGLAVLVLALIMAVERIRRKLPFWPNRELRAAHYWLFTAYAVALLSGAIGFGSEGLFIGGRELVRAGSTVAAFLLVFWWVEDHPERYRTGWTLLFLGAIAPVTVAVWQWVTGQGYTETVGLNRLYGTFSHPLSLGPYLVPFILFAAGDRAASWQRKLLRAFVIGLFTVILALTYSRTVLIVLLAGFAVLAMLHALKFGARAFLRILAVSVVVLALVWGTGGGLIRDRFTSISMDRKAVEAALEGRSENSFTWRILLWRMLIQMSLERPVSGHGAGMTTVLNPLVNVEYDRKPFNAHNDFVRWFFEGGALGLLCYVVYGVTICWWALRRSLAASRDAAPGALAVAAALIATIWLSLGTTEYSSQTAVLYQFNGMLALLWAVPIDTSGGAAPA